MFCDRAVWMLRELFVDWRVLVFERRAGADRTSVNSRGSLRFVKTPFSFSTTLGVGSDGIVDRVDLLILVAISDDSHRELRFV